MRRRDFIKVIAGSTATWPLAARSQQGGRIRRVGVLMGFAESDPAAQKLVSTLRAALASLGWTRDGGLQIEVRGAQAIQTRLENLQKSWSPSNQT